MALRLLDNEAESVQAQALIRATQSTALILRPVLGSTLLLFFRPTVGLVCDASSFGIGATALLFMNLAHHPTRSPQSSLGFAWRTLWSEIADGIRFTMRDRTLVILMVVSSITALVSHLWYSVDVFFVQSSLHAPKESVGLLWTISGVGGLVGSLLILSLGNRHRLEAILLTGLFLRGTSLIWYALMTSYTWAVPAAFLAGLGDNCISVVLFSLLMEQTKHGMLGRVTAFQETASVLTTLPGTCHGWSSEKLGLSLAVFAFLRFCSLLCWYEYRSRAERPKLFTSMISTVPDVHNDTDEYVWKVNASKKEELHSLDECQPSLFCQHQSRPFFAQVVYLFKWVFTERRSFC